MSDEMAVTLAYPLLVDGVEVPADETVTLPWQVARDLLDAGRARPVEAPPCDGAEEGMTR